MSQTTDHDPDHELDVREIDGPPFEEIMAALEGLDDDERLLLINSFEPEPLYGVLEARGFAFESSQRDDEEWHIHIEHAR